MLHRKTLQLTSHFIKRNHSTALQSYTAYTYYHQRDQWRAKPDHIVIVNRQISALADRHQHGTETAEQDQRRGAEAGGCAIDPEHAKRNYEADQRADETAKHAPPRFLAVPG